MRRQTLSTIGITEGALLSVMAAVLALAGRYVPVLGLGASFLVPVPLAVLVIRRDLRAGILATIVAGLISAGLAGPLEALPILILFAPFGLVIGTGVRKGFSAPAILGMTIAVAVPSMFIGLALTLAISGVNPLNTMVESMRQGQEASLAFYKYLGINAEALEQTKQQLTTVLTILPKILPGIIVLSGIMLGWINYQTTRLVLGRLGYRVPALPPMSSWRIPAHAVWTWPIAMLLIAVGGRTPFGASGPQGTELTIPGAIGANLMIVAQLAFAVQGAVVAWVLLKRYMVAPFMRALILTFLIVSPIFLYMLTLLGLLESVYPIRDLGRKAAVEGKA